MHRDVSSFTKTKRRFQSEAEVRSWPQITDQNSQGTEDEAESMVINVYLSYLGFSLESPQPQTLDSIQDPCKCKSDEL